MWPLQDTVFLKVSFSFLQVRILQQKMANDAWKLCKALKGRGVMDITLIWAVTVVITAAVSAAEP